MNPSILSSVQNGLKMIQLFTLEKPVWGITEMSQALMMHKTTISRLAADLVEEGYLEKTGSKYKLGLSLLCLSGVITTHLEIYREAKETLDTLVQTLEETVHIAVLEDTNIIYLYKVECKSPIQLQSYIGKKNPATCTSSGKVIMAFQPENVIANILTSGLPKLGPNSVTEAAVLIKELQQIKRDGYAICIEELDEGVTSIAAPLRDYTEQVIAAISIVGPKTRIDNSNAIYLAKLLQKAATDISQKLGYFK